MYLLSVFVCFVLLGLVSRTHPPPLRRIITGHTKGTPTSGASPFAKVFAYSPARHAAFPASCRWIVALCAVRTGYRPFHSSDWLPTIAHTIRQLAAILRPWHQTVVRACYSSRLTRTPSLIRRMRSAIPHTPHMLSSRFPLLILRSSICAPPSLAPYIRRANSTVPRMQSPFSGGFRMIAALRSPLSISAHSCRVRRSLHQLSKSIAARSLHQLGVPQSLATHMEINANKSRPRSRNPRFYRGFRTFAPIFHTSELANLGVARRIRHLTRGNDARNASATARPPMHTHARTHERTHASVDAHASERTRTHTQGPPRPHTREKGNWRHFSARSKCDAHAFSLTSVGVSGMRGVLMADLTRSHARERKNGGIIGG